MKKKSKNLLSVFVFIGADHLLLPSFQTNGPRVVIFVMLTLLMCLFSSSWIANSSNETDALSKIKYYYLHQINGVCNSTPYSAFSPFPSYLAPPILSLFLYLLFNVSRLHALIKCMIMSYQAVLFSEKK